MSIEKARATEDQILEEALASGEITTTEYNDQMAELDRDQRGYEQEEFTHLAVAAAIASGRADCGLGIAAAAKALDLDFISLFQERYDLIIPTVYAESDLLSPLFESPCSGHQLTEKPCSCKKSAVMPVVRGWLNCSTYLAIMSTSRLISSPTCLSPRVVCL